MTSRAIRLTPPHHREILLEIKGVCPLRSTIVGHEKPRITFGLYSGGASLSVKAKAIELAKYPAAFGSAAA